MAVYIDNFYITGAGNFRRMKMSHMVADTTEELLEMVDKLGMKRQWIQNEGTCGEHFDVALGNRKKAIALGAKEINFREYATFVEKKAESHGIPWTHVTITKINVIGNIPISDSPLIKRTIK